MLLALDIGNTNVTVGAFRGETLVKSWRLASDAQKTADEYGVELSSMISREGLKESIGAVVYGSVVPALSQVLESACRSVVGVSPVGITPQSKLGIRLLVDRPQEVGVDRVLNALAVHARRPGPAVVLDFGTATTFDCVSARGDYLGGAIAIGPGVAAKALREHTAQLPLVDVRKPERVIGKNTVDCIQSGLYYGYLGLIERVLEGTLAEMRAETGKRSIRVLATGGLAGLFADELSAVSEVVPDLTLQGLRLAYEKLRDLPKRKK